MALWSVMGTGDLKRVNCQRSLYQEHHVMLGGML
jgi:hypothetical protein